MRVKDNTAGPLLPANVGGILGKSGTGVLVARLFGFSVGGPGRWASWPRPAVVGVWPAAPMLLKVLAALTVLTLLLPTLAGCGGAPYSISELAERLNRPAPTSVPPPADAPTPAPSVAPAGNRQDDAATTKSDTGPAPFLADGSESGEAGRLSVDRIAYISPYGDLFTVKADGSDERRLTGGSQLRALPDDPPDAPAEARFYTVQDTVQDLDFNNVYAWPTWSPDGARLAVSRVQVAANRSWQVSVQVIDAVTGRSRMVYENDVPALVADGAPHYLYWSPDGRYLSFLAATRQGLTLFAVNPDTTEGAVALERGAPLYYSWGGNGLLIHSRAEVKLLRSPISPGAGRLLSRGGGFRAPALSPDGERWAYAEVDAAGSAVYLGQADDPAARPALQAGPLVAFMWSPDGQTLAVADNRDAQGGIFQRVQLVAQDGSVRTLVEEPLLAFYWSPDGQRLAWVSVDAEDQVFEWKVAPAAAGSQAGQSGAAETRELFRFRPSGEVFTMLSFFDQYAYSHSPWSPDGSRLVVAGSQGPVSERRNGHTPTGARVYVLDAVGDAPPREIAAGSLAVWSWN